MGQRILVIDDNEDFNQSFCDLLESHGYEPTVALNGREGVDAFGTHKFDAVCLDISLPDMDGLEVCRRLRSISGSDDLLIIGISGWTWASRLNRRAAVAAGCDLYLPKPVDIAKLDSALKAKRQRD